MIKKKEASIKRLFITVSLLTLLVTMAVISLVVFSSWMKSAEETTQEAARVINESVYRQFEGFMGLPRQINMASANVIRNGVLDLSEREEWEKFFAGVLQAADTHIYGVGFGMPSGAYYGAQRTQDGQLEIVRSDEETGGQNYYYSVSSDLIVGEKVRQTQGMDVRIRQWYLAARTGASQFSAVYKHLDMDELVVTEAMPIYDREGKLIGVFATHLLLSSIGEFLEKTVENHHGSALIVEKETRMLVANSMGVSNYILAGRSVPQRTTIGRIGSPDIVKAFELCAQGQDLVHIKGEKEKLYICAQRFQMEGLDWVVISAQPSVPLLYHAIRSIQTTIALAILALLLSVLLSQLISTRMLHPVKELLDVSQALSGGDLTRRVTDIPNNEIGRISASFNQVADKMQYLINNLEAAVAESTAELQQAYRTLEESKNQLRLILDSTAEAIYGIDLEGNCTFCNLSCVRMLGYDSQEEILGKKIHELTNHSQPDGTPIPSAACPIYQAMREGVGIHRDDEIFWRKDGTPMYVEYHSYPQTMNGETVGFVVTFMDITQRKKKEAEIQYLSCHDVLTGFYNRRCFEEYRPDIDVPENLPLTVIYADINGLKMTNDIFGHAAGDALIAKAAEILRRSVRASDVLARLGGDEFVALMPHTRREEAEKIMARIREEFSKARIAAVKCNVSLGAETKTGPEQSFEQVMANAETAMYKDKTLNRKTVSREMLEDIVESLHAKRPQDKVHAERVSQLCGRIGEAMGLSAKEVDKLRRAGYLHDIGKIVEVESRRDGESGEDAVDIHQHALLSYRILNLFDDTLDLAEAVYSHHERWNGSGYPRGLQGEEIPLISRIIAVAEVYDRMAAREGGDAQARQKALEYLAQGAGSKYDPQVVAVFLDIIKKDGSADI